MNSAATNNAIEALVEERVASLRDLAESQARVDQLATELKAAQDAHTAAYRAIQKDGWTPRQLKSVGITDPQQPTRRTKRATAAAREAVAPENTWSD